MNMRLELIPIPVADVDRAKSFYADQVGFGIERDVRVDAEHRFVELMPPGSSCSIALTTGYIEALPGTVKGLQLNVDDAEQVREHLLSRGVEVSAIEDHPWGRFCFFTDPDGNSWSVHGPVPPATGQ